MMIAVLTKPTADTLARKWRRYLTDFDKRAKTLQSLDEVTLEYDRNRWETQRREFEARRIRDPRLVDGMLDHPDTRAYVQNMSDHSLTTL